MATSSCGHEIPFWLPGSSRPKWVSGIDDSVSVSHILQALATSAPNSKSKSWVLVEKWRGVEKALSPSTRILGVWLAWAEEQPHVRFVVKSRSVDRSSSTNSRRRRTSSTGSQYSVRISDTKHPNKFVVGADVHAGEESVLERLKQQQRLLGERGLSGSKDLSDSKMLREGTLASDRDLESVMSAILEQGRQLCEELQRLQHRKNRRKTTDTASTNLSESNLSGSNLSELISELSKLSNLNETLEAKETEMHLLNSNLEQLRTANSSTSSTSSLMSSLSVDLASLKALNASAHTNIDANRRELEQLHCSMANRRSLLKQLEYDVNVIEKEGRKLTRELDKIRNLDIPCAEDNDREDLQVQQESIYRELKALRLECQNVCTNNNTNEDVVNNEHDEDDVVLHADFESTLLLRSAATASPEGSSSGISSGDSESNNNNNDNEINHVSNAKKVHFADEVSAQRRLVDELTWTLRNNEQIEEDEEQETLV